MTTQSNNEHPAFTPFILKGRELPNRFIVAPMSRVSATEEGIAEPIMEDYYASFAAGGFSMIITEGTYTDKYYSQGYRKQPGIVKIEQIESWKRVVEKVKKSSTLFVCQLMHAGALSQSLSITKAPFAVQPLGKKMEEYGGGDGMFPLPYEMTHKEIKQAIEGFVISAKNAWKAGFDGVEIHAANGYLLDQFLTSYTNKRADQYGGSIENRYRIIQEIIKGIKAAVPVEFLIGLRLSEGKVNDLHYRWPEGSVMAQAILKQVKQTPPDYLHIAAESGNWKRDCVFSDGSSYPSLAKEITKVPVVANGGLGNMQLANEVLANDHADLLAIGRAALADSDWVRKTAGRIKPLAFETDFIRPSATIEHTNRIKATKLSITAL